MTNKNPKDVKEIKFKYHFSNDYNPLYVNGAFGGISSKGEIIINFFLERVALPKEVINKINADGSLGKEIKFNPEDYKQSILRHIQTGIVVNLNDAKAIHEWLGNKIDLLEKMKKEIQGK